MSDIRIPVAELSRELTFSAAHRLHNPDLPDERNKALYGKCNRENGHGHNYRVKVTVEGEVDPDTGMIIPLDVLKEAMKVGITDQMDHANLDRDVEFFHSHVSTTENIAIYIWCSIEKVLRPHLSHSKARLSKVTVWETDANSVTYRGQMANP